jgi:hypothetical protein
VPPTLQKKVGTTVRAIAAIDMKLARRAVRGEASPFRLNMKRMEATK